MLLRYCEKEIFLKTFLIITWIWIFLENFPCAVLRRWEYSAGKSIAWQKKKTFDESKSLSEENLVVTTRRKTAKRRKISRFLTPRTICTFASFTSTKQEKRNLAIKNYCCDGKISSTQKGCENIKQVQRLPWGPFQQQQKNCESSSSNKRFIEKSVTVIMLCHEKRIRS